MMKENAEITDIVELMRNGPVRYSRMYEQERNFDAGYTPSQTEWKTVKKEVIDGKTYYVYS
jgi:hypothetical protein